MRNRILAAINCLLGRPTIYQVSFYEPLLINKPANEKIKILDTKHSVGPCESALIIELEQRND